MKSLLTVVCLLFAMSVFSMETIESKADTKALADVVMKDVALGKIKEGIGRLRPYAVTPIAEFDAQLSQLDLQLPAIAQRFGSTVGYHFLETQEIGDSIVQYVYLQKLERHVLVWRFIFYKPKDKWLLNTWYFNDQVQTLFD